MIKIDPATHLDVVSGIIQSKYLAIFIFALALGMGAIPVLATIFDFVISLFLYVFPFYLFFTLIINGKTKWAVGLVIWMVLSFIPMQVGTEINYLQAFLEYLPLLFLIIYCIFLNYQLKHWGYKQNSGQFPLWF